MFYVPVSESYMKLPVVYTPVYTTVPTRIVLDDSSAKLNNELTQVKEDCANLRSELQELRSEKESCFICSKKRYTSCDGRCSLCDYRRRRSQSEIIHSRPVSPVHYCSVCDDYVTDEVIVRATSPVHYCSVCQDYVIDRSTPPPSPVIHIKPPVENRLSEYLSRQMDLRRLRQRRIPEERPVWIPTAYKQDYPHRRWFTRNSNFSEP